MKSKTYEGKRLAEGCEVYVVNQDGTRYPLSHRTEIRNHSPTGLEWGFGGSGPAQLALAILADHFGPQDPPAKCPWCDGDLKGWDCQACGYDGEREGDRWRHIQDGALVHYQDFKRDVVSQLPHLSWTLTSEQVEDWAVAARKGGDK